MMIPLVVIRPQPGADATAAAASALGLEPQIFPLFEIAPVAWDPPDPAWVDALLVGSANAMRLAGPALARFRDKPVHAVGQTTAEACRAAGFTVATAGTGGLQGVLAGIAAPLRLLRLAGREHVALDPPTGVELVERIVYASIPQRLPQTLAAILQAPAIVLLHSANAASHFAAECDRLGIPRARIALATIGPRVSAACGAGWARIATAATPNDAALLAQVRQLCHNHDGTPERGPDGGME